jgi:hypothetical protein
MQEQQKTALTVIIAIATAFVIVGGLVIFPNLTAVDAQQGQGKTTAPGQAKKIDKVKAEKPTKEKKGSDKVKPDKSKEEKVKKGKAKTSKQTRFEVIVDGSQVANVTDALLNYEFSVAANGLTSKAKSMEVGNDTDDISNMQLVFNTKGLTIAAGDTFSATATALTDAYVTDTVTGTFEDQPLGQSGKTRVVGVTDEPLVLAETGQEVDEQIPDDFAQ